MVHIARGKRCHLSRPLFLFASLANIVTSIFAILLCSCQYEVESFNLDSTIKLYNRKAPDLFCAQIRYQRNLPFLRLQTDDENSEMTDVDVVNLATTPVDVASSIGVSVNDRLLAELQQAAALEKAGVRSSSLKENRLMKAASLFKSSKTDAERRAAIAEAQNLNGVNPLTTFLGAVFALSCAAGLWYATQSLAEYFAMHPSDPNDAYFVVRVTAVSRNVIMGLSALASGFFGVTGFGILMLALRVGWGVVTGELDPSPPSPPSSTSSTTSDNFELDNVWDLMLNKKPKRGSR